MLSNVPYSISTLRNRLVSILEEMLGVTLLNVKILKFNRENNEYDLEGEAQTGLLGNIYYFKVKLDNNLNPISIQIEMKKRAY